MYSSMFLYGSRGLLSIGGMGGLVLHLGMTGMARNPPLAQVLRVSQSSLLQEHVADMCHRSEIIHTVNAGCELSRIDPNLLEKPRNKGRN